ncbi:hypothetical protein HMPREF9336_01606 [Segniliparus rugosus ATCC BAA-974]|uniref:Uncharacterized protein n=1 Tax=Segniliparus rugosus (strain ATCC BAA-974 / DSM 45345 / CCUG 50838 / CIP 108380 / JCM 13579 / CDC 945) TaxID=679197 RepID=E5XQ34_SEGRC|nr:hypothetical protein HMPREF9336_01606 [Segniliparus rugosus ATCC BAA-974]
MRWLSDSESRAWQGMVQVIGVLFPRIGRSEGPPRFLGLDIVLLLTQGGFVLPGGGSGGCWRDPVQTSVLAETGSGWQDAYFPNGKTLARARGAWAGCGRFSCGAGLVRCANMHKDSSCEH